MKSGTNCHEAHTCMSLCSWRSWLGSRTSSAWFHRWVESRTPFLWQVHTLNPMQVQLNVICWESILTVFLSPSLRPKSIHLTLGHHIVAGIVLAIKFLEFFLQLALGPQAAEGWIYNSAKGQSKLFSTCLQRGGKSRAIEKKTSAGHHFLSRHRRSPSPNTWFCLTSESSNPRTSAASSWSGQRFPVTNVTRDGMVYFWYQKFAILWDNLEIWC